MVMPVSMNLTEFQGQSNTGTRGTGLYESLATASRAAFSVAIQIAVGNIMLAINIEVSVLAA